MSEAASPQPTLDGLPERYRRVREHLVGNGSDIKLVDQALRRVEARRLRAETPLRKELDFYWSELRGRDFDSVLQVGILVQFREYARALHVAFAEECLGLFRESGGDYSLFLSTVRESIVENASSDWEKFLEEAREAVIRTKRGTYGKTLRGEPPREVAPSSEENRRTSEYLLVGMEQDGPNLMARWWEQSAGPAQQEGQEQVTQTPLGRNIEKLRKECGWSYEEMARNTKVDKTTILDHVHGRRRPHLSILKLYAGAFTEALKRPITPADLLKS